MDLTRKNLVIIALVLGTVCISVFAVWSLMTLKKDSVTSEVLENVAGRTLTNEEVDIANDTCPLVEDISKSILGEWTPCIPGERMVVAFIEGEDFEVLGVRSGVSVTYARVSEQPMLMNQIREKLVQDGWENTPSGTITDGNTVAAYYLAHADGPLGSQEIFVKRDEMENTLQFVGLIEDTRITGELHGEEELCPCTKEIQLFVSKKHTISLQGS